MLAHSENYQGAWIFKALPVGPTSAMYSGAVKALIIHYLLPPYILVSAVFLLILGISALPHFVVVFLSLVFLLTVHFNFLEIGLPFTQKFQVVKSRQLTMLIVSIVFALLFLGAHYLSLQIPLGTLVYIMLLPAATVVYWRKSFRLG